MIYSNEYLQKATIIILLKTGAAKYERGGTREQLEYRGLTSRNIIEGEQEAEEIEENLTVNDMDDYHEYLILHFNNGNKKNF